MVELNQKRHTGRAMALQNYSATNALSLCMPYKAPDTTKNGVGIRRFNSELYLQKKARLPVAAER